MTGSNDLDRMLASYLEEGPRRAPDRAMDAALAFAVAHPRRRDPLLFLKPDVMARRTSMFSPQFVWVAAVIALTLGSGGGDRRGHPALAGARCPTVGHRVAVALDLADSVTNRHGRSSWSIRTTRSRGRSRSPTRPERSSTAEPEPQQDVPPVDRIEATNDPADSTRVQLVWTFRGGPFAARAHDRRNGDWSGDSSATRVPATRSAAPTSG